MAKKKVTKGTRRSSRKSPRFYGFRQKVGWLRTRYSLKRKGTIGFGIKGVAPGISSPKIVEYTANLYRESRLLEKALGNRSFNRSLEIGCGYGRITPWIASYSKKHYAIEPEPELLKWAVRFNPTVKFHNAVVQDLPFPDDYFDLVVTFSVLHHIPPERFPKAIQEIKRVAHPTATIFLHERAKGKATQRSWSRSIDKYEKVFSPWKLVRSFDRNIPGLRKDTREERVMLFKGVIHTKRNKKQD